MSELYVTLIRRVVPPPRPPVRRKTLFLAADGDLKLIDPNGVIEEIGSGGVAAGPAGPKGDTGDTGAPGEAGPEGTAATIEAGTITVAAPGTPASVTNSGSSSEATFDFVLPAYSEYADVPPSSPNAKDDEFTSADTLPGGASAKWSWVNQGSATATISDANKLVLLAPVGAGVSNRCLQSTVPATPFTVTSKVTNASNLVNSNKAGIYIGDGTKQVGLCVGSNSAWQNLVINFASVTAFSSISASNTCVRDTFYFRIIVTVGLITYQISWDGTTFKTVSSGPPTAFLSTAPTVFGMFSSSENTTEATTGLFDWIRIT
jgi:hypothetical protein